MSLGDQPLLMAEVTVRTADWQKELVDLVQANHSWFDLDGVSPSGLVIKIRQAGCAMQLVLRSQQRLVIDVRQEHGPLGVLLAMSAAKLLGGTHVFLDQVSQPINGSTIDHHPALAVMDPQQRSQVSVALGLVPPPLVATKATIRGLF